MTVPLAVPVGIAWLKIAVRSGMPGHATLIDVHVAPLVAPPGQVAEPSTVTVPSGRMPGIFPAGDWPMADAASPVRNSAVMLMQCNGKIVLGFMGILHSYVRRSEAVSPFIGPGPLQGW